MIRVGATRPLSKAERHELATLHAARNHAAQLTQMDGVPSDRAWQLYLDTCNAIRWFWRDRERPLPIFECKAQADA